jgi:hypothetical protein
MSKDRRSVPNGAQFQVGDGEKFPKGSRAHRPDQENQRLIKLIAVKLKEAALDSPSFRASINYYNSQVDQADQWVDGLIKFTKKYPQQFSDFKEFNLVLYHQLIPDFFDGGLVDQENTLAVLHTAKTTFESIWSEALSQLTFKDVEAMEILSDLSKVHIKRYKGIKKNFEFMQSKYDSLLNKYSSQSKNKEPSALREDAFQLFEVRKSYLSASFDICIENSKFHQMVDQCLIQMVKVVLDGKASHNEEYASKAQSWSDAVSKSMNSLLDDMLRSKEQIEQVTVENFEPSRDLKQHNPAAINPELLTHYDREIDGDVEDQAFEKHGWLWMKTTVGKPSRQIWVRRWLFVKSGIFGLFSLSPSKTFVQETDKIGVLLCNVRYAPDEDRRFCFEIKTIDLTITFQAETLRELRSWIKVFTAEKKRAIENAQSESGKFAFGRYPPLLYEFANTSLTSVDVELTSSKYDNTTSDDVQFTTASTHLSDLLNKNMHINNDTSFASAYKEGYLATPITTSRSKLALVSHEFLSPTVVPTAVTANIWGTVNWGFYYMAGSSYEIDDKKKSTIISENNFTSLNENDVYPPEYPEYLKKQDIELRSLFDLSIDQSEHLAVTFSCLWSLNLEQELSGHCFVSNKNVYFYLNSAGFVSLIKKSLSDVVAVDVVSEKDWDTLKLYDMEGLNMRGRVFLEDTKLIQKKIELLINNIVKEKPSPINELLKAIQALEANELKLKAQTETKKPEGAITKTEQRYELNSFHPFEGRKLTNATMRTNYNDEYDHVTVKSFNVPAKAMFHILYGDHSTVFRDSISVSAVEAFEISPWYEYESKLVRHFDFKLGFSSSVLNYKRKPTDYATRMRQTIEEMVDGRYYRIDEQRNSFHFFGSGTFKVRRKIVIVEQDSKSCKVLAYLNVDKESKKADLFFGLFKNAIVQFQLNEIRVTLNKLEACADELGHHGKIVKAIRTFGNLSKSDEKFVEREDFVMRFQYGILLRYYVAAIFYELSRLIIVIWRLTIMLIIQVLRNLSSNRFWILLLSLSVVINLLLAGRSSLAFWNATRTENLVKGLMQNAGLYKVERAISLDELELLSNTSLNSTSECFTNYLNSARNNIDKDALLTSTKFSKSKHMMAVKRNELLVELKILEKVEKELALGDYKNFLSSELASCKIALDDMKVDDETLKKYCSTCISEFEKVSSNLL